jgi:gamma-glutamyltranspeptidase/glutathione hydrolase
MWRTMIMLPIAFILSSNGVAGDRMAGKSFATRSEVIARHGMAATSQPLATQVALDILKQGGTPSMRPSPPIPCLV